MVEGIEASSRRLRALINDLAEFSRVGRQARPLSPAALDDSWWRNCPTSSR